MSKLHFITKHANAATVQHNWYVVNGTNQTVGRMCAGIAAILRGKKGFILFNNQVKNTYKKAPLLNRVYKAFKWSL